MKLPAECQSLVDVRAEIDRIDREILALVGRRAGYVHAAARFKETEEAVAAPERQAAVFRTRRHWAVEEDLDPDFIERLYRELIAYFVESEREHWKTLES
jgi:isochorismate pyruvate lyase